MCGIAGIYDDTIHPEIREKYLNTLASRMDHRGPDHCGTWMDDQVAFVHNRLKIIDLSDHANQPFEYGNFVIVFNGEIYNYLEIKSELLKAGVEFSTDSDTEVLVASYQFWGEDCVEHFVGMWAFAIWDRENKTLFCSRDRFGIKPFYYIFTANKFYFASEIQALASLPGFKLNLNEAHINRGIILAWTEYNDETNYKEIKSLPAAHNLLIEQDHMKINAYWSLNEDSSPILDYTDPVEGFNALFRQSITQHSRADVTIGASLSGGLDSSSITSMFCDVHPGRAYKTFNIYYTGKGNVDERNYAEAVAKKYPQIEAHFYSPTDDDVLTHYHKAHSIMDGPLLGSSYFSQYFVMQQAKKSGIKVIMSGQGSDEYLLGYLHSFTRLIAEDVRKWNALPALNTLMAHRKYHQLSVAQTSAVMAKSLYISMFSEQDVFQREYNKNRSLLNGSLPNSYASPLTQYSGNLTDNFIQHLLFQTTLPTLLHYEDRTSMAFSLESRVPFLDHRLVEFAYALPHSEKISRNGETKYLLRRAMNGILPDEVVNRKDKKAFATPGEVQWLRGPLAHLLDADFEAMHWLDQKKIKSMIDQYKRGDNAQAKLLWRLLSTNQWLQNF